jgi:activator of 2-hydroxyglutaryl-CoA dehydratase
VAITLTVIDEERQVIHAFYDFHKGQIQEKLTDFLNRIELNKIRGMAYTSSTPPIVKYGIPVDSRIAYISASKHFHPQLQALLIIGAEKFGLATFDENGEYLNYRSNSSCAAGTGNFLDQQAERLNLKDISEFSRIAYENTGSYPKIASRCAVFAKTDLIHAQQEGYSLGEICDGLSYGLAKNIVDTVFSNTDLSSHIVAAGGVALNIAVIQHIEKLTHLEIKTDDYAHVYGSFGAALESIKAGKNIKVKLESAEDILLEVRKERNYIYSPLELKLSKYPDFNAHETYGYVSPRFTFMKAVEVDAYVSEYKYNVQDVYLGIDIGSTSTKAVLVDRNKKVLAGF